MKRVTYKPNDTKSAEQERHDFCRTRKVLNELYDGTLFRDVLSALGASAYDQRSSTALSDKSLESRAKMKSRCSREQGNNFDCNNAKYKTISTHSVKLNHQRSLHKRSLSSTANLNTSSDILFLTSVVVYLGTVEGDYQKVLNTCSNVTEPCHQQRQLQDEQRNHPRVVLKIFQSGVKLFNADGGVIAGFNGDQIHCASSSHVDDRFFSIVIVLGENQVWCHSFMVDLDIYTHYNHKEKAKRFGIRCSTDSETGNCIEFPRTPRMIVKMVESLFDSQQMSPNSNADALTVPAVQGLEIIGNPSGNNMVTIDSDVENVNGSAMKMEHHIQQYITNKMKKEMSSSELSPQNLLRHDLNGNNHGFAADAGSHPYVAPMRELPPIMRTIPDGRYKGGACTLPLQRSVTSSAKNALQDSPTQEIRSSKRGKKGSRGEGIFFRVPKRSSSRQLELNMMNTMSKSSENIPRSQVGQLSGASSIESLNSNVSLPSYFSGSGIANLENGGRVSVWAIAFDNLLEDPTGVKYFTEFLRIEFSQENILFWSECERLKRIPADDTTALKQLADSIYERFLSSQATSPVNIDSKAQRLSEEALTKPPHPEMFELQQNQIYKLMKLDSYSRFLKSPLYRQCLACQVEGVPLPLEPDSRKSSLASQNESQIESRPSFSLKHRRFFRRKVRKSQGSNDSIHRNSSDSESGFFDVGVTNPHRQEDINSTAQQIGAGSVPICRLALWDGSSTVLYAEAGKTSIRAALGVLCERRGVSLLAVDIYFLNEDRALELDQDVSVLAGQEARVERKTLFTLDLLPIGRSIGVKAKSTRSARDVLKPVVAKYGLDLEDLQTRLSEEKNLLDLSKTVSVLDSLRVEVDFARNSGKGGGTLKKSKTKLEQKTKGSKSHLPGQSDMEDLINTMSTAQNGKMQDQRGLLSEMNLELPDFLKTPTPSPTRQRILVSNGSNSNNNNNCSNRKARTSKANLKLFIPSVASAYKLDVPMPKGGRLSPNPVGTGNAKARIQKLKSLVADAKSPVESKTFVQKIGSRSADVPTPEEMFGDEMEDDPFADTKWMQAVFHVPKYASYSPGRDYLVVSEVPQNVSDKNAVFLRASSGVCDEDAPLSDGVSGANECTAEDAETCVHRYTRRRTKGKEI